MKLLVGIDGGGTKTDFVLCDGNGFINKRIITDASNPSSNGFEKSANVITNGLKDLLCKFDGLNTIIDGLFAGLSGGSSGDNINIYHSFLKKILPNAIHIGNNNDAVISLSSGLKNEDGCVIICGTGSIAYARSNNVFYRAGGWGHLIDKFGSGYDIGRDAIYVALNEYDGIDDSTIITSLLHEKFGCFIEEAVGSIYIKDKSFIASLAPIVFDAYDAGDAAAIKILNDNAKRLAELLQTVSKHIHTKPFYTVLAGGIFNRRDVMGELLKKYISSDFIFIYPKLPPVFGAIVEAARLANITIDDKFENNFFSSM